MYDFFTVLNEVFGLLGFILRAVGFGLAGFALGKFVLDAYQKANWQLQIALVLGFFGLLIGLADFTSPGSVGAFALGAGLTFLGKKKSEEAPSS